MIWYDHGQKIMTWQLVFTAGHLQSDLLQKRWFNSTWNDKTLHDDMIWYSITGDKIWNDNMQGISKRTQSQIQHDDINLLITPVLLSCLGQNTWYDNWQSTIALSNAVTLPHHDMWRMTWRGHSMSFLWWDYSRLWNIRNETKKTPRVKLSWNSYGTCPHPALVSCHILFSVTYVKVKKVMFTWWWGRWSIKVISLIFWWNKKAWQYEQQ